MGGDPLQALSKFLALKGIQIPAVYECGFGHCCCKIVCKLFDHVSHDNPSKVKRSHRGPTPTGKPYGNHVALGTNANPCDSRLDFERDKENTLVSATASLRFLNTTTHLSFLMAVDTVTPELQQLDGSLAFEVGLAAWFQDDAWFAGGEELVLTASLTAYVLCYEPRAERPPSGVQRTPWAVAIEEGPRLAGQTRQAQGRCCSSARAESLRLVNSWRMASRGLIQATRGASRSETT